MNLVNRLRRWFSPPRPRCATCAGVPSAKQWEPFWVCPECGRFVIVNLVPASIRKVNWWEGNRK